MPLYSHETSEREYRANQEEIEMYEEQREEWNATRELIVPAVVEAKPTSIVRAAMGDVTEAIEEYTRLQAKLDKVLPDCTMQIRGKLFRKKSYWRAVATAFNLTLENTKEQLDENPETGAWGYLVTYRAIAPNGRYTDGDGACYASEKKDDQATVHNVRGHAHTRAMNRAISNLVGFGEVSAEEVQHESPGRGARREADVQRRDHSRGAEDAPRSGHAKASDDDAPPLPLTANMEKAAWLDETLGFGKYKARTWRWFCEGSMSSGRAGYLGWYLRETGDNPEHKKTANRALFVCKEIEARDLAMQQAADAAPDDPAWDAAQS